jgi:hypothetical protein
VLRPARYAGRMFSVNLPRASATLSWFFIVIVWATFAAAPGTAQGPDTTWSFAVSGDSRNCGDFVMPAIAAKTKAENDAFYWHLGDFRWMSQPDEDLLSMNPGLSTADYQQRAWDDFLAHQIAAFGSFPVFLGRGNHETVPPMTREGYIVKFSSLLDRPEITAQRKEDGDEGAPIGPWYHWVHQGVDFITLDNASHEEFTDAQLRWLRGVLDHDMDPKSGISTIVTGMHEALPHSTGAAHAMDDWDRGIRTGELVYTWLYDAQAAGKHVYIIASHSHFYSPNIFNTAYWKERTKKVVPGWIIGTSGAHRYKLPLGADPSSKTNIYGFMRGTVHADGAIDFKLQELTEGDLEKAKWPNASLTAIRDCYDHNRDE